MKTLDTIAGKMYVVMSPNGGTVTSADGLISETVEAGKQKIIIGTGAQLQLDDADGKIVATFNYAPAKLRLLGLLGGGVVAPSALPAGYFSAEFLESTGTQRISTNWTPLAEVTDNLEAGFKADHQVLSGSRAPLGLSYSNGAFGLTSTFVGVTVDVYFGSQIRYPGGDSVSYNRMLVQVNYKNSRMLDISSSAFNKNRALTVQAISAPILNPMPLFVSRTQDQGIASPYSVCRIWSVEFTERDSVVNSFVAAIDKQGVPCMFDKVTKTPFYNKGSGAFIVGLTLNQALKLADLPDGGGALSVSLPSNYLEDENVTNAITVANTKGWDITVASSYDEAGASSTFALRRIWVRKTENEFGQYVDVNGTRWLVESCVAMYTHDGSEPDAHGYELFRSVDAAVAYWELEPYVDPEEEAIYSHERELLTDYNENE